MNAPKKPRSLQDILKQRQQSSFVGREEQVTLFQRNLELSPEDSQRRFVLGIWGQGGVGKTTLLKRYQQIAKNVGAIAAFSDDFEKDVPEVLGRIVEQFEQQGHPLSSLSERYRVYRQKRQELEADPEAPQGFSGLVGRALAKTGMSLARQVPIGGAALSLLDEESFVKQASDWTTFVARKLTNKDEVRLVQEPIEVLTPLLLKDLQKISEQKCIALFFDTYERTSVYLDDWLRGILDGRYGEAPVNITLTISGRQKLDSNVWAPYEGLLARLLLEPFSEEEARNYLAQKQITNEKIVDTILRLSGRLPLLVATLAIGSPHNPDTVDDPSDTAAERFLKWVDDPQQRLVALNAAIPRYLQRDILTAVVGEETAVSLFSWLKEMPFVTERSFGWTYHLVVRDLFLRYIYRESPQTWSDLHGKAAAHYEALRKNLGLSDDSGRRNEIWQDLTLEIFYHRLCQSPSQYLSFVINETLAAAKANIMVFHRQSVNHWLALASRWVDTVRQAGKEVNNPEVSAWSNRFIEAIQEVEKSEYGKATELFTALLEYPSLEEQWRSLILSTRSLAFALSKQPDAALSDLDEATKLQLDDTEVLVSQGVAYHQMERYEQALEYFNRAISLDSKSTTAFLQRGFVYRDLARYEEALADFETAISLESKSALALGNKGITLRHLKRYEEALAVLDQVIQLGTDHIAWAIAHRGKTFEQMQRFDEAISDFDQAVSLKPDSGWIIAFRGYTYWLTEQYEKALSDFSKAIELDPKYAWAIARRGKTYQDMKRYEEALADYDRAIELAPSSGWIIAFRGCTYQLMEQYEKALSDFSKAIELDPKYVWAIARRGETYQDMKRYEEALADYNRAIELAPSSDWIIAFRGCTYQLMERYEEALSDFSKAIELNPKYVWAIARRGETYHGMKRYEEALVDYDRAIELASNSARIIAFRGYTYKLMEQYEEALSDFSKAIELNPKYVWAIARRGETFLALKQFDKALVDFNQAVNIEAKSDWYLSLRAITYQALEQVENAKADFSQAIQIAQQNYNEEPNNWDILLNLVFYHCVISNHEYAKSLYEGALTRGIPTLSVVEMVQELETFIKIFPHWLSVKQALKVIGNKTGDS